MLSGLVMLEVYPFFPSPRENSHNFANSWLGNKTGQLRDVSVFTDPRDGAAAFVFNEIFQVIIPAH